jgi:Tfp pilus assembly protein PilN
MDERLQVDLLRQRREELGIAPKSLVSPKHLLWKGSAYGLVPLVLVLLIGAGMLWRERLLEASVLALEPASTEHDNLMQSNLKLQEKILKLNGANERLKNGLLEIRSSSALLAELAAITPEGVQLQNAKADSGSFSLKGLAQMPGGFVQINGLQLAMEKSLFFKKSVKLKKAQLVLGQKANADAAKAQMVGFELMADFDKSKPQKPYLLLQKLKPLGSLGMAARVDAIRQLGLLP